MPASVPLLLLGVALLSYAVLLPWLGFYWDEWPITWIAHRLGPEGLARYFSTNRPYWGMLYRLTTPLIGFVPWRWQVFGLFWRWLSAVALWSTLRQAFPRRSGLPLAASLLFLVYPGFTQQSIAMMYGHFFVVLSAYLLSLLCSLLAARAWGRSRLRFWGFTALALLLALANLLAMEYFFMLELLRPGFLILALRSRAGEEAGEPALPRPGGKSLLRRAALQEAPYLALFLGVTAWRAFFFPYQTQNYDLGLLAQLKSGPLAALAGLALTALRDLFQVAVEAWSKPFLPPTGLGPRSLLLYGFVTLAALLLVGAFVLLQRAEAGSQARLRPALPAVLLGLVALLLGGLPFWLTRLEIHLTYPNDRFTLPFMLGASMLLAGLLSLIPARRGFQAAALVVLVAASAGLQFQNALSFQRDWNDQKDFFWQMSWRIPALQPGTTLISSNLPMRYFSDNSLTGPLNWIYAPENRSAEMSYMFYFASVRSQKRPLLEPGQPIQQDYLAARFNGSTSQVLAVNFQSPGCLRLLDPDLDAINTMLPELMRQAAALSDSRWVLAAGSRPAPDLTPAIFGREPAHQWCYYYEKAELARQQGDWQAVAALGDQAFALEDYPNDPMERLPFLEGYALAGNWQRAAELSRESAGITPLMKPVLCRLWARIDQEAPASGEKSTALSRARQELGCTG